MDLQVLRRLLFLIALIPLSSGSEHDACQNYHLQFERVFSVPGDVAMLSSTLLSPTVFNLSAVPYNITWYRLNSTQPISNESGRVLVMEETLWFLNITLADDGEYVTVVSTPQQCYRQQTRLVVDQPLPQCGRPRKAGQSLTKRVTDWLPCPLKEYISKLDSYSVPYSITWYKDCELIADGTERFSYLDSRLKIEGVESEDQGLYTCTLEFTLGGVRGTVSETIDTEVKGDYCMAPQVREPANDIIKAPLGSNFTKRCLVFVPCEGNAIPDVDVYWWARDELIEYAPSERIYTTEQREVERQDRGVWLESWLIISELKEQDFHLNYTCYAFSARGSPYYYFTLLPTDPELFLPVGLSLGSCMLLFILSISMYHVFKVDLVLWFRRAFPVLYTNTDSDGRLYDAYVAYPQRCAGSWTDEVEVFALQTLPQVLEKACGYRLFIAGRDCLPGEAVTESVEENLQASRRILLLYTASTFSKKYCSNNNTLLSRPSTGQTTATEDHQSSSHTSEEQQDRGPQSNLESAPQSQCEDMCAHARTQLECVAAMHRALLERSLKVILVELEELGPSQVKQLPESVRHLRQTQGAVCWWKTQRTAGSPCRTACTRRTEDAETALSSCVSPNCRFWKEVRYRMPVRGKRTSSPETSTLLHF